MSQKADKHSNNGHLCCHTDKRHNNQSCITLVPIFNHLERHQMEEISKSIKSLSYKKGEIIYRPGDESDSLYIVKSGKVKIYRLSESGKEQLLHILNPGDFTGELALFRQSVHESFAEAMENTNICMITRPDLQKFLEKYPSISIKMLAILSERLDAIEKQSTSFATLSVEKRLVDFLIESAQNQDKEFTLPMSQKDLASYLGTTPESISRKLTALEDEGYIRQLPRRKIKIINIKGLLEKYQ